MRLPLHSEPVDSAFIHGLCARMLRIAVQLEEGEQGVRKSEIYLADFEVAFTGGMCS